MYRKQTTLAQQLPVVCVCVGGRGLLQGQGMGDEAWYWGSGWGRRLGLPLLLLPLPPAALLGLES